MICGEDESNRLNGALNDRINALLYGNCIEPNNISLHSARSARISTAIHALVVLGWKTEWRRFEGCSNPESAVHCNDRSEVQNVARQELDAQIRSEVEARAVQQKWSNGSLGLLEWDKPSFTIRKFDHKWYCHERCQSCRGRGEVPCGCFLGKVTCTSCGGNGTITFVAGVPARTHVRNCAGCYGSGQTTCWTCYGSSRVNCQGCAATGWFTLVNEGEITADISKTIDPPPPEYGEGQHLLALPIETLVPQGDVKLMGSRASSGQVSFEYRVAVSYVVNTYRNQDREFEVHGIGRDLLVPKMPTFLDECIKPVADQLILANNHDVVLRSANGCRVTKTMLLALGTKSNCKPTDFVARFENAVSLDLIERLLTALTLAYNSCGSFAVRRIWLKATIALNLGIAACVLLGVPEHLVRRANANVEAGGLQGLVLFTAAIVLALIWLTARHAALKAARSIVAENISRPPSQGVLPIALCAMTLCCAYFVSEAGSRVGKPFANAGYIDIHAASASPMQRSSKN
jgi:hypothetical protein